MSTLPECKGDNYEPIFKKFPNRTAEEVIFHFMSLPLSNITNVNVFDTKKPSKHGVITLDQREAINTLIGQDTTALDDYNNPVIQHAAVFKIMLDIVSSPSTSSADQLNGTQHQPPAQPIQSKSSSSHPHHSTEDQKASSYNQIDNDMSSFKNERNTETDSVLAQVQEISAENAETIKELTEHLKDNAQRLRDESEVRIRNLLKVLVEYQLAKIEQKLTFLDEYEKYMFHETKLLDLYKNHLKVERIEQELEHNA